MFIISYAVFHNDSISGRFEIIDNCIRQNENESDDDMDETGKEIIYLYVIKKS